MAENMFTCCVENNETNQNMETVLIYTLKENEEKMIEVPLSIEELSQARFTRNSSVIVKGLELFFGGGVFLENALLMLSYDEDKGYEGAIGVVKFEKATEQSVQNALTLEEALKQSVEYLKFMRSTYGNLNKLVLDDIPLLGSALNCQAALFEAIEDVGMENKNNLFSQFVCLLGYEWWMRLVGFDKSIELLRYFFEQYLPLVAG